MSARTMPPILDETVKVTVPRRIWGRLATEADMRGVTIEDILVAAINHVIHPNDRTDRIIVLVNAGYPDAKVAEIVGETRRHVSQVRRYAGLPANVKRDQRAA